MKDYTKAMEASLFNKWEMFDDSNDDCSDIIHYLESENFRPFGEGQASLIPTKENEMPIEALKKCCRENGIDVSKEISALLCPVFFCTKENWFG